MKRHPTLSLCMIVKNEATTLERCLETARPYVDEIVIVDTGSTDGTQDIARRYADVFKEMEWPNSFAIARNISMDLASGTHILILDGDEYIPEADHWREIRQGMAFDDMVALLLFVRNLLPEGQIVAEDCIWQERVFRNHPSLRYSGRVHNQIGSAVQRFIQNHGGTLLRANAEIVHTGYQLRPADARKKYTPRIHLLEREIEEAKDAVYRSYYQFQLATVFYMIQDYRQVLDIFEATDFSALIPFNRFYAHMLAAHAAIKLKVVPRALYHANEMTEVNPDEPMGYYTAAHALFLAGEASTAVKMLSIALNKNEHKHIRFPINEGALFKEIALICKQANLSRYALFFGKQSLKQGITDSAIIELVAQLEQAGVTL